MPNDYPILANALFPQGVAPQTPNPYAVAASMNMAPAQQDAASMGNPTPASVGSFVSGIDPYKSPRELTDDQLQARHNYIQAGRRRLDEHASIEAADLYKKHPFVKLANAFMPGFEQAYWQGKFGPLQAADAAINKHIEMYANDIGESSNAHYQRMKSQVDLANAITPLQNNLSRQGAENAQGYGAARLNNASADYVKSKDAEEADNARAERELRSAQAKEADAATKAKPLTTTLEQNKLDFDKNKALHDQAIRINGELSKLSGVLTEKQKLLEHINGENDLLVKKGDLDKVHADRDVRRKAAQADYDQENERYKNLRSQLDDTHNALGDVKNDNTNTKGTDETLSSTNEHPNPGALLKAAQQGDPAAKAKAGAYGKFLGDEAPTSENYEKFLKSTAPKEASKSAAEPITKTSNYKQLVKKLKENNGQAMIPPGMVPPPPPGIQPSFLPIQQMMQQGGMPPQQQQQPVGIPGQAPLPGQDPLLSSILNSAFAGANR